MTEQHAVAEIVDLAGEREYRELAMQDCLDALKALKAIEEIAYRAWREAVDFTQIGAGDPESYAEADRLEEETHDRWVVAVERFGTAHLTVHELTEGRRCAISAEHGICYPFHIDASPACNGDTLVALGQAAGYHWTIPVMVTGGPCGI